MKNSALPVLAILISALALCVSFFPGDGEHDSASTDELAAPAPDRSTELELEALREETRALRDRLSLLETVVPEEERTPLTTSVVTREEFEALREELLAAMKATKGPGPAGVSPSSPEFKEQLATTLSEIQRDKTVAKIRAGQEKRLARLDETMPKLESSLGLTRDQSDRMRSALLARYEREDDLLIRWESGEDPEVLGEIKLADRETHRVELEGILSADQLQTYQQMGRRGGK